MNYTSYIYVIIIITRDYGTQGDTMEYSNLMLILELPQQSTNNIQLALIIGALLGAVITGGIQLLINRSKNKNNKTIKKIKAYGQLMGQKKEITQLYRFVYTYGIKIYYNEGVIKYIEHMADLAISDRNNQIKEIEDIIEPITIIHDRVLFELIQADKIFWETIGLIQSLFAQKKHKADFEMLIRKIEAAQKSLDKFDKKLEEQITDGLPETYWKNIPDGTKKFESSWERTKQAELDRLIEILDGKIDNLLQYVHEQNKQENEVSFWHFW